MAETWRKTSPPLKISKKFEICQFSPVVSFSLRSPSTNSARNFFLLQFHENCRFSQLFRFEMAETWRKTSPPLKISKKFKICQFSPVVSFSRRSPSPNSARDKFFLIFFENCLFFKWSYWEMVEIWRKSLSEREDFQNHRDLVFAAVPLNARQILRGTNFFENFEISKMSISVSVFVLWCFFTIYDRLVPYFTRHRPAFTPKMVEVSLPGLTSKFDQRISRGTPPIEPKSLFWEPKRSKTQYPPLESHGNPRVWPGNQFSEIQTFEDVRPTGLTSIAPGAGPHPVRP